MLVFRSLKFNDLIIPFIQAIPIAQKAGMPFIDDELLWCPDNDGRMVDISANPQGQEITGNTCDLSELDPLCNDSEEILRQLAEHPFELDSFFQEFNGVDVKVRITNLQKKKTY